MPPEIGKIDKTELEEICINCGMCCDGTLFKGGHLYDDADKQVAKEMQMDFTNGEDSFQFPCKYFDKKCTVYHRIKPKICDKFYCVPLTKAIENNSGLIEAKGKIENLLFAKKALKEALEKESFTFEPTWAGSIEKLDEGFQTDSSKVDYSPEVALKFMVFKIKLKEFFEK